MLLFDLKITDCGLFATANAMAICNGQSPEVLKYNTKVMRKHLAGCLEDKVLHHFPASNRSVKQKTSKSEEIRSNQGLL